MAPEREHAASVRGCARVTWVLPGLRPDRREVSYYSWFLHRDVVDTLLQDEPARRTDVISRLLKGWRTPDAESDNRRIDAWLRSHDVPSLESVVLRGDARPGLLVWVEQEFRWSDVATEHRAGRVGATVRSTFSGRLAGHPALRIHGSFNPGRLTCSTALSELQGNRTQYVLGSIAEVGAEEIEVRPIVIGTRLAGPPTAGWHWGDWQSVQPRHVDQFRGADWDSPPHPDDLAAVRQIPESAVKAAFASLIGEPVVPKDWGGEQFDLWTTRLTVDGQPTSAAFLLKGPAAPGRMTVATLGRNGDQLDRLAGSTARLLVVQHCDEITPAVTGTLRAYASDYRDVRRYMVIDGYDTYRILVAAGVVAPR